MLGRSAAVRYAFALAAVAAALGLKILLTPLTGTGAPFVLFVGAALITTLLAGTGPGAVAIAASLPLGAYLFAVRAGYSGSEATFQGVLYCVDGITIAYLTSLMSKRGRVLDAANRELRRLSDEAARSEGRTRQAIELAPDAYFLADLDARYIDVNHAACKLLGYERNELVGKTIFDVVRAGDVRRLETERSELLVPGTAARAEWTLRRKDGSYVPVEVSANILPDGRWQAFVRDITERKRVEDERLLYASLLDNSVDFVGVADPEGNPLYVNAAGRRMVGLPLDAPINKTVVQDFYPPELRSFVKDVVLKNTSERGYWAGETYMQNFQTRKRIPVSEAAFVIRDPSGQRILGLGTVVRDITDARRKADEREQLLAREQLARRRAEAANAQLRLLDQASTILASSLDYQATVAATAQLAVPDFADWCSVDVLVGNEIKQLAASHHDTPELRHMSEVREQHSLDPDASSGLAKVIRTGETLFMPDATEEFLSAQARTPEHFEAMRSLNVRSAMIVPMIARDHIIGALTMVSMTAGRPYDQGSLTLARDIARRAAVAIDNAHLYQTAVLANEAKANFLATMSHELRTPLTAIIGYEELLAGSIAGPLNDAQLKQLGRIKVNAQQLLGLIEEILLYARVEAGRESVHVEEVRAKEVVDEAISSVAPLAQERHLSLTAKPIPPSLALRTDGGKLRQMLINLIENAVKFTERGAVTVGALERGPDVIFEVKDTGIGIAPENLERVFESFWQVEQRKTRRVGGSGLGLSTVRRLATLLGGNVSVESQQRVGSTFRIALPREPRAA
jgi:PAS domain S-box-containing protein